MAYVDLNGHKIWVSDTRTAHEPLVLLHGVFGDGGDFDGNLANLASQFRLVVPDRRGHGRTPDNSGPLSHHEMARDTIALLESLHTDPVRVVGYSDGAVVALLTALERPDLIERLVLISGVFHPDGWIMTSDHDTVDSMPTEIVERYGRLSPDGAEHFPVVAHKLADIADEDLGVTEKQLGELHVRTMVMAADDDIIHAEHTLALYRNLSQGELAIVPGTSHHLLHDKPGLVTGIVAAFLSSDPTKTGIPIRRASDTPD